MIPRNLEITTEKLDGGKGCLYLPREHVPRIKFGMIINENVLQYLHIENMKIKQN